MASTKIPLELTAYAPDADGATLELQTTDTTVTDGSVLGKIEFKAPKEASGTDAILVGAAIEAVAEGTFAADNNATELVFKTGASEAAAQKMMLTSAGHLSVGATSITNGGGYNKVIQVSGSEGCFSAISSSGEGLFAQNGANTQVINRCDGYMQFRTNNVERLRIDTNALSQYGGQSLANNFYLDSGSSQGAFNFSWFTDGASALQSVAHMYVQQGSGDGGSRKAEIVFQVADNSAPQTAMTISNNRNLTLAASLVVAGAVSKTGGSFKIDHPLESKKDTHSLVHSFVESPQANNIYRGEVTLSSGQATVNLDTVSGMTEGTFVALNTSIHCFTTNESDWDAVKGSVSGNTLSISCQNASSTAKVSWLVIGERQDEGIKGLEMTDSDGKLIVEPTKEGS